MNGSPDSVGAVTDMAHVELTCGSFDALRAVHFVRCPPTPTDAEIVRRAQEFLHEHFAERVRLSALADSCRLSPFQMIRLFRRVSGMPPFAYLVQVRVNRAQALLREGSSLSDVAYSRGFSDQSHLTRAFKRVVGVPPGQYARSVRPTAA